MRERWREAQEYELEFWKKYAPNHPDRTGRLPLALDHVPPQDLEGKRVLEVGCGPMGAIYYSPGALRVGIDPLARKYVQNIAFSRHGVELVEGMGEQLPFPDGAFDVVICGNVIDHVDQPSDTLTEISRVLRPEGQVILWVHVIPRWLAPVRKVLDRIDTGHPYHMTERDMYALMRRSQLHPGHGKTMAPRLGWSDVKTALGNLAMRTLVVRCTPARLPATP